MMTWEAHFVFQKEQSVGSIKLLKTYYERQSLLQESERTKGELLKREFQQSNASVEKVGHAQAGPGGELGWTVGWGWERQCLWGPGPPPFSPRVWRDVVEVMVLLRIWV